MNTLGDTLRANDAASFASARDPRLLQRYEERRARNLIVAQQFFDQARVRFERDIAAGKPSHELGIRVCRSHKVWNVYGFDFGLSSFGCAAKVGEYYQPWREFCVWAQSQGLNAGWQSVSIADTGARHYVLQVRPAA